MFPALVTRKVTQNNGRYAPKVTQKRSICAKSDTKNGRYAPKVSQKRSICAKSDTKWDTKSKSDVYRLAQYNTDFRRAAQARRLRLAGHIWTQYSYLIVIRHYRLYNLLDLPRFARRNCLRIAPQFGTPLAHSRALFVCHILG